MTAAEVCPRHPWRLANDCPSCAHRAARPRALGWLDPADFVRIPRVLPTFDELLQGEPTTDGSIRHRARRRVPTSVAVGVTLTAMFVAVAAAVVAVVFGMQS